MTREVLERRQTEAREAHDRVEQFGHRVYKVAAVEPDRIAFVGYASDGRLAAKTALLDYERVVLKVVAGWPIG